MLDREAHELLTDVLGLHTVVLARLPRRGAEGDEAALVWWGRFLSCRDLDLLDRWLVRAATATTATDVFES